MIGILNTLNIGPDGQIRPLACCEVPMQILKKHGLNNVNEKMFHNHIGRDLLYSMLPTELADFIKKTRELIALEDDSAAFTAKLNEFTPEQKQELEDVGYISQQETAPADDNTEEAVSSVQEPADENVGETDSSGEGRVAIEELIKRFLTAELMEELTSKVDKLPKTTSLDVFKKEIIRVLCKHVTPSMVVDGADADKVSRWSIEDLSTILSIDMLSEFVTGANTKKKAAIEAAVNKYGKAAMVTYGLLISNIASQLVMALYN